MRFLFAFLLVFQGVIFSQEAILSLGTLGSIRYIYDAYYLLRIERLSSSGEIMYAHSYHYNENGKLISESLIGNLGEIEYEGDLIIKSPFSLEICEYNNQRQLTKHTQDGLEREYEYNSINEIISEERQNSLVYDDSGNLIQNENTQFCYDEDGRLIKAFSDNFFVTYTYDASGKRKSRKINGKTENYFHFGINEIAIINDEGTLQELRIPGLSTHKDILRPIAIETNNAIYAPIHDVQGNIVKLINIATQEIISLEKPDPFGKGLSKNAPISWIFAGKYYDKETGLIYFGHRYYSPDLKKWITTDPAFQSADLYQYCFNNPFYYFDPDGRASEAAQEHYDNATQALIEAVGHSIAAGFVIECLPLAAYEGYEAVQAWKEAAKEYNAGVDEDKKDKEGK